MQTFLNILRRTALASLCGAFCAVLLCFAAATMIYGGILPAAAIKVCAAASALLGGAVTGFLLGTKGRILLYAALGAAMTLVFLTLCGIFVFGGGVTMEGSLLAVSALVAGTLLGCFLHNAR